MNNELFNYRGKNCVVTGAAAGVGKALCARLMELGANVYGIDINPVENVTGSFKVDLCHKEQIDAAIAQLPQLIDALFSNAATAGTTYIGYSFSVPEVFCINFVACRYLVEHLQDRMPAGSAIVVTSSTTGLEWAKKMDILNDMYEKGDTYENAKKWAAEHIDDPRVFNGEDDPDSLYTFCKQSLIYYVKRASFDLLKKGIRINVLCPGGIDTQMTDEIARMVGTHEYDMVATNPIMGRATSPDEQACCLLFFGSDLSICLDGADLISDYGWTPGVIFNRCTDGGEFVKETN